MLLTNGRCCTQVADCVIASFLAIGIVVVMEVTQDQWNRDCATARRVLRSGGIGILAADDLVQEAWLSFLRNGHDGRYMARKLGFLYRTACRGNRRAKRFVEMDVDPAWEPRGDAGEALESLRACGLSEVSESVFEGLLMGLTRMEIARRLDLTIATVNWIVARWRGRVAEGVCHAGRSRRGDPGDSREHDGGRG
jgi:DNA-directed RNA polymerase specialized sigma24 family protein